MSLRYEEYRALKKTRAFLRELLSRPHKSWTAREIKEQAYTCIKHYPHINEYGKPLFSKDEFTTDDGDSV